MHLLRRLLAFGLGCCPILLVAALVLGADTVQNSKTTAKKTTAKKDDKKPDKDEEELAKQNFKRMMDEFKRQDTNGNGYLELSELVAWMGLGKGPDFLKAHDTDKDGKISRDEYEAWAQGESSKQAKDTIEKEKQLDQKIKDLEEALAKASTAQKQKLEEELRRARQHRTQTRHR